MTPLFAPSSATTLLARPRLLQPGQDVHVNVGCVWIQATITSCTRTRIGLIYPTPAAHQQPQPHQSGRQRPGPQRPVPVVPAWLVRPADGVCLYPVGQLCAGLQIVTFDGALLSVAAARRRRDQWWDIHYTDAEPSRVPPRAVLRVADATPAVTVHGRPLRDAMTSLSPVAGPAAPLAIQKGMPV